MPQTKNSIAKKFSREVKSLEKQEALRAYYEFFDFCLHPLFGFFPLLCFALLASSFVWLLRAENLLLLALHFLKMGIAAGLWVGCLSLKNAVTQRLLLLDALPQDVDLHAMCKGADTALRHLEKITAYRRSPLVCDAYALQELAREAIVSSSFADGERPSTRAIQES